jgi:hypothetical protein
MVITRFLNFQSSLSFSRKLINFYRLFDIESSCIYYSYNLLFMKRFSLYIFLFLLTLALLSRSNELSLESDVAVEDTTEDPQTINNSNDDNDVNPESTDSVEPIAEDISPSSSSVPAQTTNILLPHIFVLNLDRATDRWQNIPPG